MKSFFFGKGHDPTRCEKLRKETSKLRSQILQYDASTSLDVPAGDSSRSGRSAGVKKLGDYCIACELSKLFQDMFSTDGGYKRSRFLDPELTAIPEETGECYSMRIVRLSVEHRPEGIYWCSVVCEDGYFQS